MTQFYAHSENDHGDRHALKDHLFTVAELAKAALSDWQGREEAGLAGLLHDLGKYGDKFQDRLNGVGGGLDHWSQGAWVALKEYQAVAAALSIQGHHVGLQYLNPDKLRKLNPGELKTQHPLNLKLSEADVGILTQRLKGDGLQGKKPQAPLLKRFDTSVSTLLDIRILFSALVDADYLDTEAHFAGGEIGKRYRAPGLSLQEDKALAILEQHLKKLETHSKSSAAVATIRQQLHQDCRENASLAPGLFTLTAPTGSGKTLAMLVFALTHAKMHGLKRIVMVIPYLSIIEQTAAIYRAIFEPHFGGDYILEHHSLAGGGREQQKWDSEEQRDRRRQQLAENWDAPLILTTNVQLLESLFSNRPSQCRKLHRLRNSIILFDEAQTLPRQLTVPTLAALSHLAAEHRCSVVFSTATQPAFSHLHESIKSHCPQGWRPREIVADPQRLFTSSAKTAYVWHSPQRPWSWPNLINRLKIHRQALCVVNLKRHAKEIIETLDNDAVLHLSTNQCPAHRIDVLNQVRQRLQNGQNCILIATQCIEAGVDVDFPVVYRSYGPLDAIIQAAGRCNREGKLEQGEVHVFCPENERYPPGGYQQATDVTKELIMRLGDAGIEMHNPAFITGYYKSLYDLGKIEATPKTQELLEYINAGAFPEIAQSYRLIEQDTINIIVPYKPYIDLYEELQADLETAGLNKQWIKKARPLTVSLYRPTKEAPIRDCLIPVPIIKRGYIQEYSDDWFLYNRPEHYHTKLGLAPSEQLNLWIA